MLPPSTASSSTSYRVVYIDTTTRWATPRTTEPIRDLPVAACRAAVAAERHGGAWIVAADDSAVMVTHAGVVHDVTGAQLSGWGLRAARVITNRKGPLAP